MQSIQPKEWKRREFESRKYFIDFRDNLARRMLGMQADIIIGLHSNYLLFQFLLVFAGYAYRAWKYRASTGGKEINTKWVKTAELNKLI